MRERQSRDVQFGRGVCIDGVATMQAREISDCQRRLEARGRIALQPAACCLLLAGAIACGHEATQPTCSDICPVPPTPVIYGGTSFIIPSLRRRIQPHGICAGHQRHSARHRRADRPRVPARSNVRALPERRRVGCVVGVPPLVELRWRSAPNDAAVLTRIFGPDSLALFAPGMYSVSVATTNFGVYSACRLETYNCPVRRRRRNTRQGILWFFVFTSLLVVIATVATFVWPTRHRYDTYHPARAT